MTGESLVAAGQRTSRLFRLVGRLKFVQRLHDFLLHGGRESRARTLAKTAAVVLDIEKAKEVRARRLAAVVEMMKAAGFTADQIQEAIRKEEDLSKVGSALETLMHYVEWGQVTVDVVADPRDEPTIQIEGLPGLKTKKRKGNL